MTHDTTQADDGQDLDEVLNEPERPAQARRLLGIAKRNVRPLILLGLAGSQLFFLVQIILLTVWVSKLARHPAPTLVELQNGTSMSVAARDPLTRNPESIRKFVALTLNRLFSWSSTKPPGDDGKVASDKGVVVSGRGLGGRRVPTPTYEQGFALSESFRGTFLGQLGDLVPRTVFGGGLRTVLVVSRVSNPVEIEPGRWKVDVIGTLVTFTQADKVGQGIEFNKTVYVQAVFPPPESDLTANDDVTRTIAKVRSAGLEVYRINDFTAS